MNIKAIFLGAALCFALGGTSVAPGFIPSLPNQEDRVLLVDWHAPHREKKAPEPVSFPIQVSRDKARSGFAVVVSDGGNSEGWWGIEFDGEPFFGDPIINDLGAWYMIPGDALAPGRMTMTLRPGPGVTSHLERVLAITLDGTGEEVHFGAFVRALTGEAQKAQPAADPLQLQVDMRHLELDITLNMAAANIPDATAKYTIRSLVDDLEMVALDFNTNNGNMTIHGGTSNGVEVEPFFQSGRIYIPLDTPQNEGDEFTVSVSYSGTPVPNRSFRRTTHGGGIPMIYTNNQPYDARLWLPSKDIPEDKFTTDFIINVPDQSYNGWPLFATSMGTLVSNTANDDGTRTYRWVSEYPVASYLVSITCTNYRPAVGAYVSRDGSRTMEVAHYVLPQSYASESPEVPNTIEIIEYFADTFGEYPFINEKYWTSTWGLTFGMEHQTVSSMPNGNLATPFHRRNIHEIAHMWFGNAVTLRHYDHLWLNEGWATYLEALAYEYLYGRAFYHQFINNWNTSDAFPIVSSRADEFNYRIVYTKAAWVLHMFRKVVGDELFFEGARNFIADPDLLYATADTDDLIRVYSETIGEDVSWFFNQWLYRAVRPTYDYFWEQSGTGSLTIGLEQRQAGAAYRMPLDFEVRYTTGEEETHTLMNEDKIQSWQIETDGRAVSSVTLDPDNWVLANKNLVGVPDPPAKVNILAVLGDADEGTMTVSWQGGGGLPFRVYTSPDGHGDWSLARSEDSLPSTSSNAVFTGYEPGDMAWFRVARVGVIEGHHSEIYGARLGGDVTILNVDGYERWPRQSFGAPHGHNIVAYHGNAQAANGFAFDTASNARAANQDFLRSYDMVNWILAEESTQDSTFTPAEQNLVKDFLEAGNRLFVSGNEIGWDLVVRSSTPDDTEFYEQWLKAEFLADDSGIYTVGGTGRGSAFCNIEFGYGGGDAPYFPGWPDLIAPINGSETALVYTGGGAAAVQYFGTFGDGDEPGALIHFGFSFETISTPEDRAQVMNGIVRSLMAGEALPCFSLDGFSIY